MTDHSLSPALTITAPNGTYFACSSGLSPHIVIASFVTQNDYCVLVLLLPRLSVHHTKDLLLHRAFGHPRSRREPIASITVGVRLALGASGAGTGIASLVETNNQFRHLSTLQRKVDADLAELKLGLTHLTNTVNSLAEMVLQYRRGLNLAFLKEGGVCAALKEECCVFIDETGLVRIVLSASRTASKSAVGRLTRARAGTGIGSRHCSQLFWDPLLAFSCLFPLGHGLSEDSRRSSKTKSKRQQRNIRRLCTKDSTHLKTPPPSIRAR